MLADHLAKVDCGKLTHDLVLATGHQDKKVLKGCNSLEIMLEQCRGMLDDVSVWLLELEKDLGQAVRVKVVQDTEIDRRLLLLFLSLHEVLVSDDFI